MHHLSFIALFGALSLLALALHFLTKQHRNVFLVFGIGFLVLALSLVPSYINAYAEENAPQELLSISDSLDFYGTVLGLLSSFLCSAVSHPTERSDKTRTGETHEIYQLECRLLRQCLKSHPSSHSISVSRDFPGLVLGSYPQFWGCVPFLGPICVFPTLYSSPKIPDL